MDIVTPTKKDVSRAALPRLVWKLTRIEESEGEAFSAHFTHRFAKRTATIHFEWCGSRAVVS